MNTHLNYLKQFHSGKTDSDIPTQEELRVHLKSRIATVGIKAFDEFHHLQRVASRRWSAMETAHFSHVLRGERGSHGARRSTPWKSARKSIARLPGAESASFEKVADDSQHKLDRRAPVIWSAAHCKAVADALVRWHAYCKAEAISDTPTAVGLNTYAEKLVATEQSSPATTLRSASDYIRRIYSGYSNVLVPDFRSAACEFVLRDWDERAKLVGATTKTGLQLVGARTIYDLGFELMNTARTAPIRGLNAATLFRNGLILSFGIALPKRARALSALAFDRSLYLLDEDRIRVRLSADDLKMAEYKRRGQSIEFNFQNPALHAALGDYRKNFRPIFDDGNWLFPSRKVVGGSIGEHQIGLLASSVTKKALGIKITIHRFRDNVSTDASEYMVGGPMAGACLMDHSDVATTKRHYDHSKGMEAAKEFAQSIEARKTVHVDLAL